MAWEDPYVIDPEVEKIREDLAAEAAATFKDSVLATANAFISIGAAKPWLDACPPSAWSEERELELCEEFLRTKLGVTPKFVTTLLDKAKIISPDFLKGQAKFDLSEDFAVKIRRGLYAIFQGICLFEGKEYDFIQEDIEEIAYDLFWSADGMGSILLYRP